MKIKLRAAVEIEITWKGVCEDSFIKISAAHVAMNRTKYTSKHS